MVLLYSTANCIQSLGIDCDGRQYKYNMFYIYIYIKLGHFAVQQKLAHYKLTIL